MAMSPASDGASIFCMHANQATILRCPPQSLEDAAIIQHENARIGHEKFEAGYAFADEIVHLPNLPARNVGHDAVKRIVADCLVGGFAHPGIERLA